ncbi:hypothetical protein BJ138DRAFT_1011894 [Hygrophoropsis aurantiaca]|uniref:Uncharacterized protein n=1 Tax=Hygrophoropsis aurantiaca TaxID=72124 RepID=A0ACB8A6D8_9AGAM|nr:hypothetical protein BJ138DRAFT_1011894 [Hygrophoropsis aurantiaca]
MPSPYIPRHNLYDTPPQLQPQPQHQRTQSTILRRTNSHSTPSSAGRRRATSVSAHSPWRVWDDEPPSSFDLPSATPSTDHIGFTLPSSFTAPNTLLHTPSSTLSRTASMSGYHPPTDRPTTWRRDFKFRSGLSSIFRLKGSNSRSNELSDSSKLSLHPYLRHDRSLPPTILDLRREPSQTLVFREIDHPVGFDDMIHSCTNPPTPFMRIYHSRLPWYIDIHASGNPPYVTLADLFLGLYTSLSARIHRSDYYNDELNAEDREILKKAWEERCRSPEESADGVKRVDYLRGKVIFEGLVRGKNGMWQLKTGREYS